MTKVVMARVSRPLKGRLLSYSTRAFHDTLGSGSLHSSRAMILRSVFIVQSITLRSATLAASDRGSAIAGVR